MTFPESDSGLAGLVPSRATAEVCPEPILIDPPRLDWRLEPWRRVFFRNLSDILLRRNPRPVKYFGMGGTMLRDVFVNQRVSTRALFDSGVIHVLAVVAIIGITKTYFTPTPELRDAFAHTQLTYYQVSEYLPEIRTPQAPRAKTTAPADPVYAKQEIISVPPEPDNDHQTIITASKVKLKADVPLPNIVMAPPPTVATEPMQLPDRPASKLEVPPEIVAARLKIDMPAPGINASAPPSAMEVMQVANGRRMQQEAAVNAPRVPVSVAVPAVNASSVPKPVEVMQVANGGAVRSKTLPVVDAPKLKVGVAAPQVNGGAAVPAPAAKPIQVANGRVPSRAGLASGTGANGEVAAPAVRASVAAPQIGATSAIPKAAPTAKADTTGDQLLALSTRPAPATGPLQIPQGSRSGSFSASPSGRAGATGTPPPSDASPSTANSAASGISITGGSPTTAASGAPVVASNTPPANAPAATTPKSGDSLKSRMMAMAAAPHDIQQQPAQAPAQKPDENPDAQKVFGEKRYYRLTINMPNLTSASGSWVIRFAELNPLANQSAIPLAAPVPLTKVDPGYPPDAVRDKIEGTVVLYAVIHADGSISDVRVVNSVNSMLDASAMKALQRWRFRPGSKNGQAVDVEAVIQVPFRLKKLSF